MTENHHIQQEQTQIDILSQKLEGVCTNVQHLSDATEKLIVKLNLYNLPAPEPITNMLDGGHLSPALNANREVQCMLLKHERDMWRNIARDVLQNDVYTPYCSNTRANEQNTDLMS